MTQSEQARARLEDPATYDVGDLDNCDVVMKGGITSGVVYPLAVCELATRYRLRNVGGSSAGAIAAGIAAAAEHGRRGGGGSFAELAKLPEWLSTGRNLRDLFQPSRRTRAIHGLLLAAIRKPTGVARFLKPPALAATVLRAGLVSRHGYLVALGAAPAVPLLAVLGRPAWRSWALASALVVLVALAAALTISTAGPGRVWRGRGFGLDRRADVPPPRPPADASPAPKRAGRMGAALRLAGASAAVAAIVALHLVWIDQTAEVWTLAVAELLLIVGVAFGAAVAIVLRVRTALPRNGYGLVTGSAAGVRGHSGVPPLSDWLNTQINRAAGLEPGGDPLTFGDLRNGPPGTSKEEGPYVNLEMLTTCLSLGRSFRLPWDLGGWGRSAGFFFHPDELRHYLPGHIVDFMKDSPPPILTDDWASLCKLMEPLRPLPSTEKLPVVLAVRMSISFPFLLSAVPLYRVDWTSRHNTEAREVFRMQGRWPDEKERHPVAERCWFSDGGITSNFPVHFFDRTLPRWPTFGFNLRPFHRDHPKSRDEQRNVWSPRTSSEGTSWWTRWETEDGDKGFAPLAGFAAAIADTMQNWMDNGQITLAGFRDRVVHINHSKDEGGMNLDMPPCVLDALSERGRHAGVRLVRHFGAGPKDPGVRVSWPNNRWTRVRMAMAMLEGEQTQILESYAYADPTDGSRAYKDLVRQPVADVPSYRWTRSQQETGLVLFEGTDGSSPGGLVGAAEALRSRLAENPRSSLRRGAPRPLPERRIVPGPASDPGGRA